MSFTSRMDYSTLFRETDKRVKEFIYLMKMLNGEIPKDRNINLIKVRMITLSTSLLKYYLPEFKNRNMNPYSDDLIETLEKWNKIL